MRVLEAKLKDVKIIEPDIFGDHRGFFTESYSEEKYKKLGIDFNLFKTIIHYQLKLVLFVVYIFKEEMLRKQSLSVW